ncbi:Uncharacterised protein [Mycobacteroides abscessus]|nr:Uncharacterised protein [Mycobacteroides abscessus]
MPFAWRNWRPENVPTDDPLCWRFFAFSKLLLSKLVRLSTVRSASRSSCLARRMRSCDAAESGSSRWR